MLSTLYIALAISAFFIQPSGAATCDTTAPEFSWDNVEPEESLVWHSCYSDKECARLKVPLDYENPDGASAAIAIIRIRHTAEPYHGPILLNPGGPGASGITFIRDAGEFLLKTVGPEFDVVGFDPRGIKFSTPRPAPFTSRVDRELWNVAYDPGSANASDSALARLWAHSTLFGNLAEARDDGSLRFFTTDYVARDMLQILGAYGQEKLQFWGFSYGSVLGAVFSAMFPDKVGRVIIDGVMDAEDYFATRWATSLLDADKALLAFAEGCVAAGPKACAFYSPSASEILANIDTISTALRARPLPVFVPEWNVGGGVDFSFLRAVLIAALYSPYTDFPVLAQGLADLQRGNATSLFRFVSERGHRTAPFQCGCGEEEGQFESVPEFAFICNDGAKVSPDFADVVKFYRELQRVSSFADVWAHLHTRCVAWPDFPKTHFQGPFVANTSHPLLVIGNTADPVTPLTSAKKMAQGFTGAVVLTQDSVGHASTAAPSVCTSKFVRAYFVNGTLPAEGTVCPVDAVLFPDAGENTRRSAMSEEDREIVEAGMQLARTVAALRQGKPL
ncbi:Abhydrolase-4 domain-containing protein [Mycena kentingensis (nom. inval.)]|nr:Abhydrolase-4 domain-containing protein [Mycena kentingensis (nom. inval.)]